MRNADSSRLVILAIVPPVAMKEMHEGARQQDQVWREAESMPPMLSKYIEEGNEGQRSPHQQQGSSRGHILMLLNRKEFAITLTDDSAMAAAAIIGESNNPKIG